MIGDLDLIALFEIKNSSTMVPCRRTARLFPHFETCMIDIPVSLYIFIETQGQR